jgi:hypothetical protein
MPETAVLELTRFVEGRACRVPNIRAPRTGALQQRRNCEHRLRRKTLLLRIQELIPIVA